MHRFLTVRRLTRGSRHGPFRTSRKAADQAGLTTDHVRVINAATGELLRELAIDPRRAGSR
jgi:hypothetical protein